MKNWKTTLAGLATGIPAIIGGVLLINQGDMEKGALAIAAGLGAIGKGWVSQDAVKVPAVEAPKA
jgi:hypothetical protein